MPQGTLQSYLDSLLAAAALVKSTTIDLNQIAGTYDLFVGTSQSVLLMSLVIRMTNGAVAGAVTGITIQTNDNTPQVIIPASLGLVVNLTDQAQLAWHEADGGPVLIAVGKKIQLTIVGGAAGVARVCEVVATYRVEVAGGSLA